jgi:hypothetical protein
LWHHLFGGVTTLPDTIEAAAGLPRARFLEVLFERGITILEGPSTLGAQLAGLAERLGDDRPTKIAQDLSSDSL